MKKIIIPRRRLNRRGSQKGIALITTLIILTLIVLVVVIFFMSVRAALRSSRFTQDSAELKNLRDSAISLALAQIREGTTQTGEMWTSQPGAIRTFSLGDGSPQKIFKLYSDEEMNVDVVGMTPGANAVELSLAGDVPANWDEQGGGEAYVDLNEPVLSGGELFFPIVDPRLDDGRTPAAGSQTPEGFSYQQQHPVGGSGNIAGIYTPGGSPEEQRVPMPVKWIYTLRDGSLGTLNDSGTFVPFNGENAASADNPISGRFAFWTDDESCKINVNTASEAIPWDTPRCASWEDALYASFPPVRNEVQRFGGHPASTCLSSVFYPNKYLDRNADKDKFKDIYDLVPRVNGGGYLDKSTDPITFDTDRLYANIEEALLQPDRAENSLFDDLGPERLSRSRFFLTANSRAPELSVLGHPRICLWPIYYQENDTHRTTFDRLIYFNSRLNKKNYLFLRTSVRTNRWVYKAEDRVSYDNEPLVQNLQWKASNLGGRTQGYPRSMVEKYEGDHGVQNMFTGIVGFTDYMRQVNFLDTTQVQPGVRVVPYTDPLSWVGGVYSSTMQGQMPTMARQDFPSWLQQSLGDSKEGSFGDLTGIATNGIGRMYVPSEVGLVFSLAAENKSGGAEDFNEALVTALNIPEDYKAIQVGVLVEGFAAAQGYTMIAPCTGIGVFGLENIRLETSEGTVGPIGPIPDNYLDPGPFDPPVPTTDWGMWMYSQPHPHKAAGGVPDYPDTNWWVGWGGSGGRYLYVNNEENIEGKKDGIPIEEQYSRGYFLVPSSDATVTVKTTSDTVEGRRLHLRFTDQRARPDWGSAEYDNPRRSHFLIPENMVIPIPVEPTKKGRKPTWSERYTEARANNYKNPELIDPNDVVRTWVSRHGDHRLVLVREHESDNASDDKAPDYLPPSHYLFVPHPGWDPDNGGNITDKQIHSFVLPGGKPEKTGEDGSGVSQDATFQRGIAEGVTYAWDVQPDFTIDPDNDPTFSENIPATYPYSVDPSKTRDFDNGTGSAPDGAYWNKVDDVAKTWSVDGFLPPYFAKFVWDGYTTSSINETSAPNQQMPSAVMFGSINSAAATGLPWTTYLFRPDITPGGHLGSKDHTIIGEQAGAPPDHLILDWFWMPVVQPYALSERFATAGKINMNYRIAPFSYLTRATGLHAVLKSERMLAIPTTAGATYKNYNSRNANRWRYRIDAEKTLKQFEYKFDQGDVFRLASEICEQFLVPKEDKEEMLKNKPGAMPTTFRNDMIAFWDNHRLTGDNTLERPYANLYPRLTTRSNVFRVHLIAQTLVKPVNSNPATFGPGDGTVTGEYRGEALMERAIDPNQSDIPNYYDKNVYQDPAQSLDNLYFYRILYQRRFAP